MTDDPTKQDEASRWIEQAQDLQNIRGWGKGYFSVNPLGHAQVHPSGGRR